MFEGALFLQALAAIGALFHLVLILFGAFFSIVGSFVIYSVIKGWIKERSKQKEKRKITEKYLKDNKDYFKITNS